MKNIAMLMFWALLIGALMYVVSLATAEFQSAAKAAF